MHIRAAVAAVLFVVGPTIPALAWGSEGHRVVAEIAEQHLEPATARQVHDLLAIENATTLAEVSTWADQIRLQRPNTGAWHYVDIPLDASGYKAARDCPNDDCVVARIELFAAVLANKAAPAHDRLEALKFVTHFVADVHQPLHAEGHADKGGNLVWVTGFGGGANLHQIWDTNMVEADDPDERSLARRLQAAITDADARRWQEGTPADWANESHALAVVAYAKLGNPAPNTTVFVPESYVVDERPVIETQLEKAGVRLAAVLNRAFN
jgi:hypothetical protein